MKKRIFFLLLTVCLLLTLMSVTVMAAGTQLPSETNGKIVLTEDVELAEKFVIDADQTLEIDLAGHTLTGPSDNYAIDNQGTVTITDTGTTKGKINGVALSASCVRNIGTMTINGVTVESAFVAVKNEDVGTLTIFNSSLSSSYGKADTGTLLNWGTADVSNTTITATENSSAILALNGDPNVTPKDSHTTLTNCSMSGKYPVRAKRYDGGSNVSYVTIDGGAIDAKTSVTILNDSILTVTGNVSTNGNALATIVENAQSGANITLTNTYSKSKLTVPEGVTLNVAEGATFTLTAGQGLTVYGLLGTGTFKGLNVYGEDKNTFYTTLNDAVTNAESGVVKVIKDHNLTKDLSVKGKDSQVTIDLNGHIVSGGKSINVTGEADLLITDFSTGKQGKLIGSVTNKNKKKVTIEDVEIDGTVTNNGLGTITVKDAKITGTVTNNGVPGAVTITNSSIDNKDIAAETLDGKVVALCGSTAYATLQAAIDKASTSKKTVKLLVDIAENVTIAADQTITLELNGKTLDGGTAPGKAALTNSGSVTIKDSSTEKTGTIKRSDTTKDGCYYTIENNGTMTIMSGKVYNHAGGDASTPWSGSSLICNGNKSKATLTIFGGEISQDYFIAVKNDDYGELCIDGGTISSKTQAVQNWGYTGINGEAVINGEVTTFAYEKTGVEPSGKINIGNMNSGIPTINGDVKAINYQNTSKVATINILNGIVNGSLQKGTHDGTNYQSTAPEADTSVITVKGGSFSEKVALAFCADDFAPVTEPDENGKYTVAKVTDDAGNVVMTVDPSTLELTAGSSDTLTVKVSGQVVEASNWASSDESVATVEGGVVTANKEGTAIITASVGNKEVSCTITVTPAPVVPTYTVTAPADVANGTVTVTPKNAVKNSTVTITVTPDEGYELSDLTVTDAKGNKIELTDQGDGKYTFKMPGSKVTVAAAFTKAAHDCPSKNFTDVDITQYYHEAVDWAVENGITTGTTETTFEPNASCTRAQAVTFLWRAAGCPEPETADSPFEDVQAGSYYEKAVLWAVENGITNGTAADKFSPNDTCTRAHIVTFLWRAAGKLDATGDMPFTDVAEGQYYEDAVQWAVDREITNGTAPDKFSPNDDCTRGQIVTFLYRDRTK